MKFSFLLLVFVSSLAIGQNETGISFIHGLTWNQIKTKAKAENKFIFVDIYATWCGPCKRMEQEVYSQGSVGNYFNNKFISVKIQMDRSKNDDVEVKSWYATAEFIANEYRILAYPSYLFFSPNGELLEKETGYKSDSTFLEVGRAAIAPGHIFENPYKEYDSLIIAFRDKGVDFVRIPYMIETAREIRQNSLADSLKMKYYSYLDRLKRKELFTKDNIEFIASNLVNSKDKYFQMFYKHSKLVNKTMQNNYFSRKVVDKVINIENVDPMMNAISMKEIKSGIEPDWKGMYSIVKNKYDYRYAGRIVRSAKVAYYWRTQGQNKHKGLYVKYFSLQMENNDLDSLEEDTNLSLNTCAYTIFQIDTTEDELNIAIRWTRDVLRRKVYKDFPLYPMDTYANLIYKKSMFGFTDQIDEAIAWETEALKNAIDMKDKGNTNACEEVIRKMKSKLPTWPSPN